jgi:hypothetical protein
VNRAINSRDRTLHAQCHASSSKTVAKSGQNLWKRPQALGLRTATAAAFNPLQGRTIRRGRWWQAYSLAGIGYPISRARPNVRRGGFAKARAVPEASVVAVGARLPAAMLKATAICGTSPVVSFARSGIAAHWNASCCQSILELVEACDVPVRWSCHTGVCHSCESGPISGAVVYGPEPLERPADGNLLVCSQPIVDIVIDLSRLAARGAGRRSRSARSRDAEEKEKPT